MVRTLEPLLNPSLLGSSAPGPHVDVVAMAVHELDVGVVPRGLGLRDWTSGRLMGWAWNVRVRYGVQ